MRHFIAYILFFISIAVHGQDIISLAQNEYNLGHFEQADSILLNNMQSIKGADQIIMYRILALSSLNQERPQDAEVYVGKLLAVDPYFTAYGENPRFVDILERLKKGKTVITTASKIEETTEEVPVPVTLITEDMIKASGARTLGELLILYVPGMSEIGSIENNVAMRGVYGLTQEHMLVMLNGHRLNSYSTNAEALDFRQNLDKIKQIEVLRGPASSLYGNVALTAVINIITKTGSEMDGASIIAKAGIHNSYGGTVLFGKGNLRSDVSLWGSVYSARGQVKWEEGTKHFIGGYNNKPSFDFGANIRWDEFKMSVIGQHSKTVPYYNLFDVTKAFSYDKYFPQNGEKPGASRTNVRIDLDYSHDFGNLSLSLSGFAGTERVQIYNSIGDTVPLLYSFALLAYMGLLDIMDPHTQGVWQTVNWEDYSFGGSASLAYKYRFSDNMFGSLLGGVQYDYFMLADAVIKLGFDFRNVSITTNQIFNEGDEQTFSAFLQLKHNFTKKLILNGGLRFDHKRRNDGRLIDTWSPRVALIYLPNDSWSIKAAYAHSFVDAPFLYRASQIKLFRGSENMNPEQMDAVQVGATLNIKPANLKFDVNLFTNNVYDLVFFTGNDASSSSIFENAGKITIGGAEGVIQYNTSQTLLNLNVTYQYPFHVENFSSTNHNISNVPKLLLNFVGSQRLFSKPRTGSFWIRANMHMQSKTDCLDNSIFGAKYKEGENFVIVPQPAFAIFGAGLEWKFPFNLTASVDTYNLFNTQYRIGGKLQQGNPGQGFSFVGKLKYEF